MIASKFILDWCVLRDVFVENQLLTISIIGVLKEHQQNLVYLSKPVKLFSYNSFKWLTE